MKVHHTMYGDMYFAVYSDSLQLIALFKSSVILASPFSSLDHPTITPMSALVE